LSIAITSGNENNAPLRFWGSTILCSGIRQNSTRFGVPGNFGEFHYDHISAWKRRSVVFGRASREYQPAGQLFEMALRNQLAAETIPLIGS